MYHSCLILIPTLKNTTEEKRGKKKQKKIKENKRQKKDNAKQQEEGLKNVPIWWLGV